MTLTQEILDAIREAPETVEWSALGNIWHNYQKVPPIDKFEEIINYEWRIKPKPYEARHEIWLDKTPKPDSKGNIFAYVFGDNIWNQTQTEHCTKRFEIIVRELLE